MGTRRKNIQPEGSAEKRASEKVTIGIGVASDSLKNSIERFSFECRKEICFASTALYDRLKNLAPLFHPIRSKTKPNH